MRAKIFNDSGRIWAVRLVAGMRSLDPSGLPQEDSKPAVEFYDARYEHTALGQFVSRYYVETLIERQAGVELRLDMKIPEWTISGATMDRVVQWMREAVREAASAGELAEKHGGIWGEHPSHTLDDWKYEVANDDTRSGYWDWVRAEMDTGSEDDDRPNSDPIVTEPMIEAGRDIAHNLITANVAKSMNGLGGGKTWDEFRNSGAANMDLCNAYVNDEIDSVTAIYLAMHRARTGGR
jgi:hypothetical protein